MVAAGVPGLAHRTYNLGSAPTDASGFHNLRDNLNWPSTIGASDTQ
jgi:hypothetical protein